MICHGTREGWLEGGGPTIVLFRSILSSEFILGLRVSYYIFVGPKVNF